MYAKKKGMWIWYGAFTLLLSSCNQATKPLIQTVSEEANSAFLTGKGLDTNLYSSKDIFQYYQISNHEGVPATELLNKLEAFASDRYKWQDISKITSLDVLFYRKKVFSNYASLVYEAARDNENGNLPDHKADLVARIIFSALPNKNRLMLKRSILYHSHATKPLVKIDTLLLKSNSLN